MAKVYFTPHTLRLYKRIKDQNIKVKVRNALAKISENPYLGKKLKGELSGQYSLRIWPYRIIYYLAPNKDIVVTDIGHRKDIYR